MSYECAMTPQCSYKYPSNYTCISIFSLLFNFQYAGYVDVLPDITVDPSMNSYELLNLQSGSTYCVRLSAYTAAGEGKRSESMCFETLSKFFHTNT